MFYRLSPCEIPLILNYHNFYTHVQNDVKKMVFSRTQYYFARVVTSGIKKIRYPKQNGGSTDFHGVCRICVTGNIVAASPAFRTERKFCVHISSRESPAGIDERTQNLAARNLRMHGVYASR